MKLQLLTKNQQEIEGYKVVNVTDGKLNLSEIIDNQCEQIFAPDVVDSFPLQNAQELISGIVSKLRLGGEIVIGGTDIRLFSKAVANGIMPYGDASTVICLSLSMSTPDMIAEVLQALNLKIENIHMNGIHYEVKAKRV